jgi:putative addiction module component (TIGR02574 family)
MTDFSSILSAAERLPEQERLRLIDALWDTVPAEAEAPLSEEWAREIERRVAELDAGTAVTISWEQVRAEALARIHHAKGD